MNTLLRKWCIKKDVINLLYCIKYYVSLLCIHESGKFKVILLKKKILNFSHIQQWPMYDDHMKSSSSSSSSYNDPCLWKKKGKITLSATPSWMVASNIVTYHVKISWKPPRVSVITYTWSVKKEWMSRKLILRWK